jgi:hypothetical protein
VLVNEIWLLEKRWSGGKIMKERGEAVLRLFNTPPHHTVTLLNVIIHVGKHSSHQFSIASIVY